MGVKGIVYFEAESTGGDIAIDGDSVIIEFMDITAVAFGVDGSTGSISISGDAIEIRDLAFVETLVAGNGAGGDISLSGGDVIITGPTGTNVNDLVVVVVL